MLCSCVNSSKGSSSNIEEQQKVKKDTLYNDSIQGVFFGTPFGASKEEVVKNLEGHGFVLNRDAHNPVDRARPARTGPSPGPGRARPPFSAATPNSS